MFKDISARDRISFPGNAHHEMDIARMGQDPKTSVLNKYNQMHEVPNVFVTDGSCMTSGACLNPSLTYMALTARACDYSVKEMKQLNFDDKYGDDKTCGIGSCRANRNNIIWICNKRVIIFQFSHSQTTITC
ncbi:MAG: GMC oxidoreductase, partial [Chitinophagaceae bacterium]